MWNLAIRSLFSDRGKLLTALVGVAFSIGLVNVQGGLFLGLIRKAGTLVDNSQADIWVGHKHMHNVDFPRDIPRRWVHRVRAVPGVACAEPYLVGFSDMTLPSGGYENVVVVGVEPESRLGQPWNVVSGRLSAMRQNHAVVFDRCDSEKLEHPELGQLREIGGKRVRIAGQTRGILSFLVTPYVFTTYDRAAGLLNKPEDCVSYILVRTDPGAKSADVCQEIMRRLPEVDAYPREEYSRISANFWMTRTGIGISFGAATLLGLLVGQVMVAQTLYALVLDRLDEFATLKAVGASEGQLLLVLTVQALFMAVAGSLIGLALVAVLQSLASTPRASIEIPWWLAAGSCFLVGVICLASALLPYQRVRRIDPLIVLQG
jgi:putative ABC transport system permease protein